jgi:predicted nucleic acid-binding protein
MRRSPPFVTTVLVVDASVLATALADDGPDGDRARARLRGERLAAPELVDVEVASVLRRQMKGEAIEARRAMLALTDLVDMPLRRASHRPLLARCWELRDNLTMYDVVYVALAEALQRTCSPATLGLRERLVHGATWRSCVPQADLSSVAIAVGWILLWTTKTWRQS